MVRDVAVRRGQPQDMKSAPISNPSYHDQTPYYVAPMTKLDYVAGGFCIPETNVEETRRKANGASNRTDALSSDVAAAALTLVRVQGSVTTSTSSPSNEGCAHAPGKKPSVSLLFRNFRASRRCGARVNNLASGTDSINVDEMKPIEWQNYTIKPYNWLERQG